MKKWITGFCVIASLAALMFAPSCEKYILPKLECSPDTIRTSPQGGVYEVVLSSNVTWMITAAAIPKWVSIDVTRGSSDYVEVDYRLNVTVQANEGEAPRTAQIKYSSATLSRKLVIEQEGTDPADTPDEEEE